MLLKDLSKAGAGQRAVEIFDWMRGLDENSPLHQLCDVYTYTAMIAQCIYQQVELLSKASSKPLRWESACSKASRLIFATLGPYLLCLMYLLI